MMLQCLQTFPHIQVIELYVELSDATSTRGSSRHEIIKDDNILHNMEGEIISSTRLVNDLERISTEWRTDNLPCNFGSISHNNH